MSALLAIAFSVLTAQQPLQAAPLKGADFLLGKWSGDGWIIAGPGGKRTFKQSEEVTPKLGGVIVLIEGLGHSMDDSTKVVHSAYGILSTNPQTGKTSMRAYLATGQSVDADVTLSDKTLVWGFEIPGRGKVKYTITLNEKGQWHEVGEFTLEGRPAMQTFEMTLSKVPHSQLGI